MKNLNLEQMSVQEMDAIETKETSGGFLGALFLLMVCFNVGMIVGDLLAGPNNEN